MCKCWAPYVPLEPAERRLLDPRHWSSRGLRATFWGLEPNLNPLQEQEVLLTEVSSLLLPKIP